MSPLAGPLFAAAVVLAVAGIVKVADPAGTRMAMRTAGLPSSVGVARGIGLVEVVIAVAALAVGGVVPAAALAIAYAGFAGFAELLRRRSRGRADCGCFGRSSAPVSSLHVGVNLVVAAVAALTLLDPVPDLAEAARATPWGGAPFVGLVALLAWQLVVVLTVVPRVRAAGRATMSDDTNVVADLQGVAPEGTEAVSVRVVGVEDDTVVAFLSSTCVTCQRFWDAFRTPRRLGLPAGTRLVVVTMGPEAERPGTVTKLAPPDVPTVMSTEAFARYAVPGAPYFVHVHGPSGRVLAADTASDWEHVRSLLDRTAGDAAR